VNDTAATPQGTAVTVSVLANDSGCGWHAQPGLGHAGHAAGCRHRYGKLRTTGAISYTPPTSFSGTVSFTYTVKDNAAAISNAATCGHRQCGSEPGAAGEQRGALCD